MIYSEQNAGGQLVMGRRKHRVVARPVHLSMLESASSITIVASTEGFAFVKTPKPSRRASGARLTTWIPQFESNIATNPFVVPPTVRRETRRLRQTPHLSDEQVRRGYSVLQIDLQAGVGIETGQGEDPQVMARWSNDGGHTFGNEHWVSAGRVGQYTYRAIFRRLGSARDRVYQIVVSDPVKWRLLDAILYERPNMRT